MVRLSSFCKDKTPASLLKWTLRKTTTRGVIRYLATDGYVIVGAGATSGYIFISLDKGVTWIEYMCNVVFGTINFMYWDGGQFFAIGSLTNGTRFMMTSPDGSQDSWTQVSGGAAAPSAGAALYGMVKGPSGYWACGLGGLIYSFDGSYWYAATNSSGIYWHSVICVNGMYVFSPNGADSKYLTTPNLGALTLRDSPFTATGLLSVVIANNQAFLRSGAYLSQGGGIATSTDGVNWTIKTNCNIRPGWDLAYGNSTWMSSALYDTQTATSLDNIYYFNQPIPTRVSPYVHRILFMDTLTSPRFFALNFNNTIYST